MQLPKFTKITTGGHPAYRFDHDGKTYRAHRYASGAGAWNVDRIDGDKRVPVVRGRDTRAAAVAAVIEAPAAEPVAYFVEVDSHVQARPRVYEDRYAIFQRGLADPIERFALPYRSDRSDRDTLSLRGWSIVGELDYVAGLNVSRGRVERTPVEYGNAGHWISAHVVDPSAGVPTEAGYVAVAKCGASLIATYPTPQGHALCVACTGDPVEIASQRDRTGWLKDGGRPVKVLRALSHYDRIIASVVTTDVKGKAREWHDVRIDATAPEIIFATEEPATRDEISAGALVEAVVISNRPTVQQWRVDRAPWGDDRHTILSDGRGVVSVYTASLRVLEQPEPVNVIDRLDAIARSAAGVSGPGESPISQDPLAAVDFGEPRCVHGFYERPEDRTNPVEACKTKQPTASVGVLSDEGCVDQFDCAVQASDAAARMNVDEQHPADDPLYRWAVLCTEHEEQPAATCEDCFADPNAA